MTATPQVYASHPTLFMQTRLLTSTGLATCFKLSMYTSICKTYVRKQERNTKMQFYSEDASCFKTPVRRIQNYFWLATYNLTYSIRSTRLTKRRGTGLGTARYSPVGQTYVQHDHFHSETSPGTTAPPEGRRPHSQCASSSSFPSKHSRAKT